MGVRLRPQRPLGLRSAAKTSFSDLQIQGNPFSVDQHHPGVDELLASAIVFLVAAQRRERKEKFHGLGFAGRRRTAVQVNRGAEADPIELRFFLEIGKRGTDQVRHVVIKCHSGKFVSRSHSRFWQSRVQGKLKVNTLAESHKALRRVGDKVRLGIQLFDKLGERFLIGGLQCRQRLR